MDIGKFFNDDTYYTNADLLYHNKFGENFSRAQLKEYMDAKELLVDKEQLGFVKLGLKSYNSRYIFLNTHVELYTMYQEYCQLIHSENVYGTGMSEMKRARIYSEVEGSINIEGYNSTRALFDDIVDGRAPRNENEYVIRNMARAIEYVEQGLTFSRENLRELYSIISEDCLDDSQKLKPGDCYRYDEVFISTYNGAPTDTIEECMDSLFDFVQDNLRNENGFMRFMLPHIVHYYILYVHPYFDCNGRMARMCSLWISILVGIGEEPYYISEAINDAKSKYYKAISRTRDSRNDLTYFLIYIMETSVRYGLTYIKLNAIRESLARDGERLTMTEMAYVKKLLMKASGRYFGWHDFVEIVGAKMSKQAALKYLNKWSILGIMESKLNSRKEKVFKLI